LNTFLVVLKGGDNLVLDTVKRGEDDEDVNSGELPRSMGRSVIIRVYDALGGRGKGIIETTFFFGLSASFQDESWRVMGRKFLSRVEGTRWT
jgi:alpha-mannosidase